MDEKVFIRFVTKFWNTVAIMPTKGTDKEKIRASIARMVRKYAERSPFFLNPDKVLVKNVIAGLVRNKIEYGHAYCPCRGVKGIPEQDRGNICPCQTHKEEIATEGTCECGLFVNEAYFNAKRR